VGTFTVQIAKTLGAHVTGVCSTRNVELVRSLGADEVVDYTKQDYTGGGPRYDVIIDNVGNRSLLENRRALKPDGKYILVGGGGLGENRWIGPLPRALRTMVVSRLGSQDMAMMLADMNAADLTALAALVQAGKVTPVIDRRYRLEELPAALEYLETGHARGKIIVTVEPGDGGLVPARAEDRTPPGLIAAALIGVPIGISIVPIVAAILLDRRFRRRNPGKRPYRWGYYFSIMSFLGSLGVATVLEPGLAGVAAFAAVYAALAWFFANRHRWAWLALTILSFNPLAWVINLVYLRKRWAED
jgi:hypothetical protein